MIPLIHMTYNVQKVPNRVSGWAKAVQAEAGTSVLTAGGPLTVKPRERRKCMLSPLDGVHVSQKRVKLPAS